VSRVLENATVFRRLPVQVVDCEPELFHFMVRQPEVLVNIWQLMGLSNVSFDRTDDVHFRCSDGDGTTARGEFVWRNHDTLVVYAEGSYDGPLFPKTVRGDVVLVLKTASMRETNGRYYVTSRLDTFIHVDNVGVEIIAKMFQGWLGRTIDHNFSEAVSFLGTISHSAETNPDSMRRVAARFTHVDRDHRQQFVDLTDQVAAKLSAVPWADGNNSTPRGIATAHEVQAPANNRR
jgi:hypothetical protein